VAEHVLVSAGTTVVGTGTGAGTGAVTGTETGAGTGAATGTDTGTETGTGTDTGTGIGAGSPEPQAKKSLAPLTHPPHEKRPQDLMVLSETVVSFVLA